MSILTVVIIASGCGKHETKLQGKGWPEAVAPYVTRFNDLAHQYGRAPAEEAWLTLTVVFNENLGDITTIGTCKYGKFESVVSLRPSWWDAVSEGDRQVLMFHELGHCLLRYKHRGEYSREWAAPSSLMYSIAVAGAAYNQHTAAYHWEFFTNGEDGETYANTQHSHSHEEQSLSDCKTDANMIGSK